MMYILKLISITFWLFASTVLAVSCSDGAHSNVIRRDVCIIGGGSTGTYAAIRLREMGKSVVVVEQKDKLGGHTETYIDPKTGKPVNIGVILWHDTDIVRNYFAHFNIPLSKGEASSPSVQEFVDFRTGQQVKSYTPSDPTEALEMYGAQLAKYPYLEAGFDLPDPVPSDLVLPFGDFVKKYNLGNMTQVAFQFGQGLGLLLDQLTIYVMKNFGSGILESIATGFLFPTSGDSHELYDKALNELGPDALLNSSVTCTDRSSPDFVEIRVHNQGEDKLIVADQMILSIPPKLDNLGGFDLSATERALFEQFHNSAYYTGLITNTGLSENVTVTNIGQDTPYNLPQLPDLYALNPAGFSGLFSTKYGAPAALSIEQVQADVIATVKRIQHDDPNVKPEFATFSSHTPFELTVPSDAIKSGFYKQLYGLQGERRTFYTGAAFHTQDSSLLWNFTESVLSKIAG